ncbi:hypothetical protein [Anaerobranca gottschalkii]|uniref:Uncharacterized protein n=1 Tax=Anaerobranca gottschalkii DSM 13577 TaxID=1120990 RepID=A0A1H9ZGW2_9FIRM|nr:hypothetical protein [Anaerobranca gottschalkii]SES80838.1 hypothetical protein SAMN03080614_100922 [Anaerobranca gottschalkii DSM 13577]
MERPKLTIFLIIFLVFTLIGIVIGNQKWVQSSRVKPGQYHLEPPSIERNKGDIVEDETDDIDEENEEEEEMPQIHCLFKRQG